MYDIEIWIDLVCLADQRNELLCTLFGNLTVPMQPRCGETIGFHQNKSSNFEFNIVSPIGIVKENSVRVEVEEVSHYATNDNGTVVWNTSIHSSEISVPTSADARQICEFLSS